MDRQDFNPREDKRCAPHGHPQICATGERFWVLRVTLYQSPTWPADCTTRLLIWESTDGTLFIEHGKYWPEIPTTTDEDDCA
jgi:hypothetical protein